MPNQMTNLPCCRSERILSKSSSDTIGEKFLQNDGGLKWKVCRLERSNTKTENELHTNLLF